MTEEEPSEYSHGQGRPGSTLEDNLRARSTWMRLLFMLVIVVFYAVSRIVVTVVVVVQFFHVLFTGQANEPLKRFGQSLSTYTYQMLRYLTFNTEERPFPFDADWPVDHPDD
jgi:hypothetical protein